MAVVIIESPNKIEKIKNITGFKVFATKGHFMELKNVDIRNNYKENFTMKEGSKYNINSAINACKGEIVYIASDPDREGYGIGYHFYEKIKNIAKEIYRAEFHEITESGIKKGLKDAKSFTMTNMKMYDSYKARTCGDRIIGFSQSPAVSGALNIKALSAGRVQTPALSIIFNRDLECQNFDKLPISEKIEYQIQARSGEMVLKHILNGKEQKYAKKEEVQKIFDFIKDEKNAVIKSIEKKESQVSPPKPFTTSKLLKAASKNLGLSTNSISQLAQNLFEAGLITYIRTDSESLSQEFLQEAKEFFEPIYKDVYKYTEYKAGKNSQAEAHEAIRITHPHKYEECSSIVEKEVNASKASSCTSNHIKLYELIFKNTLQSQCKNAIFDNTIVILKIRLEDFRLSFRILRDKGFMGIFDKNDDDEKSTEEEDDDIVAAFNSKENDILILKEIFIKELNKNKPKPYLEADFIEVLEKIGIGRPSTYASYLPTLFKRGYIEISDDKKRTISITQRGRDVIKYFQTNSTFLLDLKYTAELENRLDDIAKGIKNYEEVMKEIHSKMGYTETGLIKKIKDPNAPKKTYLPSEKQINFAKNIATKIGKELPEGWDSDCFICSKFIETNKDKYNKINSKK